MITVHMNIKLYIYENWYHLITINLPVAASVEEEDDEEEEEEEEYAERSK